MTRLSVSVLVFLVLAFVPAATVAGDNPVEKKQCHKRMNLLVEIIQ